MRNKNAKPTELELLILKVLWQTNPDDMPSPVRDVRSGLEQIGRKLAHTTVITTLNTMVEKGFLKRTKHKNAFRFAPKLSEKAAQSNEINSVLTRLFNGSAEHLMSTLLDSKNVGPDEIAEIRKLINKKARELKE